MADNVVCCPAASNSDQRATHRFTIPGGTPVRVDPFQDLKDELDELLPIDTAFLNPDELRDLPAKDILSPAKKALDDFSDKLQEIKTSVETAIERVEKALEPVQKSWNEHKARVNEEYEKILRDLQKAKIDGAEFIQLKEQIGQLTPLKGQKKKLAKSIAAQIKDRRTDLKKKTLSVL